MWRGFGLVAIAVVAGAAAACGGGSDKDSTARPTAAEVAKETVECNSLTPGPTFERFMEESLEEASEMIGFQVLQPEELPVGASLAGPFVSRLGSCPEDVLDVQVMVRGPEYTIIISQRSADAAYSDLAEPIEINGVQGSIGRDHRGDVAVTMTWADTARRFRADLLGGALIEERFLEILESIPE